MSDQRDPLGSPIDPTAPGGGSPRVAVADRSASPDESTPQIVADEVKHEASELKDRAGAAAGQITETAKQEVGAVKDEAMQQARGVLDDARGFVSNEADAAVHKFGRQLADIGSQFEVMAENSNDPQNIATQLIGEVGVRTSRAAQRVSASGYRELADDAARFARNNPGLFLLGAAAAGFLVGRVLRSTDTRALADAAKGDAGTGTAMADMGMADMGTQSLQTPPVLDAASTASTDPAFVYGTYESATITTSAQPSTGMGDAR